MLSWLLKETFVSPGEEDGKIWLLMLIKNTFFIPAFRLKVCTMLMEKYWSTRPDPQSRPVVIIVIRRPSPLFKTKQVSSENNVRYWWDCGSGRVDHWWHLLFKYLFNDTLILHYLIKLLNCFLHILKLTALSVENSVYINL